jgi:hypothetical protein
MIMERTLKGAAAIRYAERHGIAVSKFIGHGSPPQQLSAHAAKREPDLSLLSVEVCAFKGPADRGLSVEEFLARRTVVARSLPDFSNPSAPTVRPMTKEERVAHARRIPLATPYLQGGEQ